jgi:hypothetical protein
MNEKAITLSFALHKMKTQHGCEMRVSFFFPFFCLVFSHDPDPDPDERSVNKIIGHRVIFQPLTD